MTKLKFFKEIRELKKKYKKNKWLTCLDKDYAEVYKEIKELTKDLNDRYLAGYIDNTLDNIEYCGVLDCIFDDVLDIQKYEKDLKNK